MKFLDQKEQVFDLQLTQYGKALLSVGAFKPVYYAFGDDDVLYDSDYTSASYGESQSDIEPRIQEETPRLSVQANYTSAEEWVKKGANMHMPIKAVHEPDPPRDDPSTPLIGDQKQKVAPPEYRRQIKQDPNKHTPIKFKLGTSAPTSDKLPAWSVSFLNGELSGSTYFYTDTKEELHHIPQLEATIEYDVKTRVLSNVERQRIDEFNVLDSATTHPDNSYISVEEDYLLLRILENNVAFTRENYDIEVYETLNDGEELRALTISDGLSQDEFLFSDPPRQAAVGDAEYYVELLTDDEIDPELMIDVVSKKVGSFYLDKDLKRIKARLGKTNTDRRDIYRSELESVEPCEDDL